MFKTSIITMLIACATLLSTAYAQHDHHKDQNGREMHTNNEGHMKNVAEFKNADLSKAYKHYLHLKTALVASDSKEAINGAKMLAAVLHKYGKSTKAVKDAEKVAAASNLYGKRKAFAVLSMTVAQLFKGQIASGEVYVAFCPMANNNQGGYWLAAEEEINNPYLGAKMLKCGSVKNVIK